MTPLRIVQLVPSLVVGGAEVFALALAEAQAAAGHDVHVVAVTAGGPLEARVPLSLRGRVWIAGKRSRWDGSVLPRLHTILARLRPDVVHTHLFTALAWGVVAARTAGVPTVVHTQHEVHDDDQWYLPHVRRSLARGLDAIVGCSSATADDVVRRGYLPPGHTSCDVVDNGIPLRGRPRAPLAGGRDGRPLVVGTVGRLVPIKGQRFLVDAVATVRARGRDVRLVIAGDGESRGELEAQVTQLGLRDAVTFLGRVDDVPARVAGFDLFVLPSLSEAMPMALLEAAAAGLPLLVTTGGGGPTLLGAGAGGWAVPPGDADALAERIAAFADLSTRERQLLGQQSLDTVLAGYDIAATAAAYEVIYRRR